MRQILSPSIGSPFYCSSMSLYRGSFNVRIGLDEASCAGLWSRPYFVVPLQIVFVVDHPNARAIGGGSGDGGDKGWGTASWLVIRSINRFVGRVDGRSGGHSVGPSVGQAGSRSVGWSIRLSINPSLGRKVSPSVDRSAGRSNGRCLINRRSVGQTVSR